MLDELEARNRKFTKILEEAIRQTNHEVMGPMLPPLTVESILPITVMVSKLRARYISEAFKMVASKKEGFPDADQIGKLREYRESYEEALGVSMALEHAINRGYLELSELDS